MGSLELEARDQSGGQEAVDHGERGSFAGIDTSRPISQHLASGGSQDMGCVNLGRHLSLSEPH